MKETFSGCLYSPLPRLAIEITADREWFAIVEA